MTVVAAQILHARLRALAHEGAETFRRIARSTPVIAEARYACGLFDAKGGLVAQAQGEPSHLAAGRQTMRMLIDAFAYDLSEDDTLLVADPYRGGTEAHVIAVAQPVAIGGDIRFFVLLRFAAADLGGEVPGTIQPGARAIWQEGLRITPVKIRRNGALQADIQRYILANSRVPDLLDGDLKAAIAMVRRMADRLSVLAGFHGVAALDAAVDHGRIYAAALARRHLARIVPDGGGRGSATATIPQGDVTVTTDLGWRDGRLFVDLSGSRASIDGPVNLTTTGTAAAVLFALFGESLAETGLNEGLFDVVEIVTRPGSCIDAQPPSAVGLGWRFLAPLVAQSVAQALGGLGEGIGAAGPAVMLFDVIGSRPRNLPRLLAPGFRPAEGLAGGEGLDGDRMLASAEEAETVGDIRFLGRERTVDGGMRVTVQILRNGFEAIEVPTLLEHAGIDQTGPLQRPRSGVLSLGEGVRIVFSYPPREALGHAS